MNSFVHFKLKMLLILCIFITLLMLMYIVNVTDKCKNYSDELCFRVGKSPAFRDAYIYYKTQDNTTLMTTQLLKPSVASLFQFTKDTTESLIVAKSSSEKIKALNYSGRLSSIQPDESQQLPFLTTNESLSLGVLYKLAKKHSFITETPENSSTFTNATAKDSLSGSSNFTFEKYVERRRNLLRNCPDFVLNQYSKIKNIKLNHILIDEKHRILYCYVPKIACTNWKRIFLLLTGKAKTISEVINLPSSEVHAKNLFKTLQNYTFSEVLNITENYTKFIFVRHPFERLLSAYRNKLEQHYDSSKYFQARFGKFIVKNFRKNPTNDSLERGDDVTFAEFINYLVLSDPDYYNEHWQRITDLCHPCLVNYDFIGKYETLIEDSNVLLRHFGMNFTFPQLPKPSTTSLNLKKYYDTLNQSSILKLYEIFKVDFRLFGYSLLDGFGNTSTSN